MAKFPEDLSIEMPPNEDLNSEQLSQSIDAEIERKISGRLKELEERLDQRVQASIHDDREFVKDTIGVAFKVAGFAVALVVVVLGALGWKTFSDVHKTTVDTATRRATEITDDHFQSPDGKRITESVLDHAVVESYLVRFARLDAYNWPTSARIKIADSDVDRLLRIIKSDDTTDTDFESAAYVLMRGTVTTTSDKGKIIKSFITAKGKDEEWRNANKEKRRWLLKTLKESPVPDKEIMDACRQLISSDDKNEFKLPAITYLGATLGATKDQDKDQDAFDKLAELAEQGKELSDEAVLAVAKIEPKSDVVKNWIAALDTISNPPAEKIATALEISEAWKENPDALNTRLQLIEFAARHSQLFIDAFRLRREKRGTPEYIFVDGTARSKSPPTIPSTILFQGEDWWTKTVNDRLTEYAKSEDLSNFRRFIRWLTVKELHWPSRGPVVSVKLDLKNSAAVALEDGEIVDKQSARTGLWWYANVQARTANHQSK